MFNQNLQFVLFWSQFGPIFGPNGQNWTKSVLFVHTKQRFLKIVADLELQCIIIDIYLGPDLAKIGPIGLHKSFFLAINFIITHFKGVSKLPTNL